MEETRIWPSDEPGFRHAFEKATRSPSIFSMSTAQYCFIAMRILSLADCNMLVIGAGKDTDLWFFCSKGNMVVVEDDPEWFPELPCKIIRPRYRGRVGFWLDKIEIPNAIAHPWSFALVDGPAGYSVDCPGRQEPIAWASQFADVVFVHDYDRSWERILCDSYLGNPVEVIPFAKQRRDPLLAAFYSPARRCARCSMRNFQAHDLRVRSEVRRGIGEVMR